MALGERAKPIPQDGAELYHGDRRIACLVCEGTRFDRRDVQMNTAGLTFFDLDWANKVALGAVCRTCGYVHTFLGDQVELREPAEP